MRDFSYAGSYLDHFAPAVIGSAPGSIHGHEIRQDCSNLPLSGERPFARTAFSVILAVGEPLPADRSYALENGPSGFDPAAQPLSENHVPDADEERTAGGLKTRYDDASARSRSAKVAARLCAAILALPEGRAAIETFFATFCADELRGPPKVLRAPGHSFSDVAQKGCLADQSCFRRGARNSDRRPVDPLRFRANLYVEGWPAWHEFDLLEQDIAIGRSRAPGGEAHRPLRRDQCRSRIPAARDLEIPKTLKKTFGHLDLGVYRSVTPGPIATGNTIDSRGLTMHILVVGAG